jgi:hypothetical protein
MFRHAQQNGKITNDIYPDPFVLSTVEGLRESLLDSGTGESAATIEVFPG